MRLSANMWYFRVVQIWLSAIGLKEKVTGVSGTWVWDFLLGLPILYSIVYMCLINVTCVCISRDIWMYVLYWPISLLSPVWSDMCQTLDITGISVKPTKERLSLRTSYRESLLWTNARASFLEVSLPRLSPWSICCAVTRAFFRKQSWSYQTLHAPFWWLLSSFTSSYSLPFLCSSVLTTHAVLCFWPLVMPFPLLTMDIWTWQAQRLSWQNSSLWVL